MRSRTQSLNPSDYEPRRRLSPWRVLLAVVMMAGLVSGTVYAARLWQASRPNAKDPWFASYVDVTATPTFQFQQMGATTHRDAILSFVVSSPTDACTPTWGGSDTLDQAAGSLDLDTRIARLQQQGGSVAISFGGRDNQELAVGCTDPSKLVNAYSSVIDRYNINTIDLDIEGSGLANAAANQRRAAAIATLQKDRRAEGRELAVWVTLPVSTQGLSMDGTAAISELLSQRVDITGVNAMTMNYGSSLASGQTMLQGSES